MLFYLNNGSVLKGAKNGAAFMNIPTRKYLYICKF